MFQDDFSHLPSFLEKEFFQKVFSRLKLPKQTSYEASLEFSKQFDNSLLQESWSYRNAFEARMIAELVLDEKGEIEKDILLKTISELDKEIFSLTPTIEHDFFRKKHILAILNQFLIDIRLQNLLKSINKPSFHKPAEQIIKDTLFLPENTQISHSHARKAALSALLTSLRQNVGSCFATAPAILIQQEQPEQFLKDIQELFSTGKLKRIYNGIEYTVPFNAYSGLGDLKRPFYVYQFGNNPLKILSESPGLISAYEEAGFIQIDLSLEQKISLCKSFLEKSMLFDNPYQVITADLILKSSLLQIVEISEKDVKEFEEKPKERYMGDLVIQSPLSLTSKDQAIQNYKRNLELAKKGFKKLTENALLKAWEYTLASFSESRADYCRWNLRVSLGFDHEESEGIGQCIYSFIQNKLEYLNKELLEIQSQYDHLFAQTKYLEGRAKSVRSENELGWVQAEYQIRRLEINQLLNQRDELEEKSRKLANLFSYLLNYYDGRFKEFFQEVYDPEMLDVSTSPYDDSPAGFRLLYKHGRSNSALWSKITNPIEFTQALSAFFMATEIELSNREEMTGLNKELTEIVTSIVMLVKSHDFMVSAFKRMAKAHQIPIVDNPLEQLDKIQKKPWAYVSGGTMGTFIATYYNLGNLPKTRERWIENELELLVFYLESLREMSFATQKSILKQPQKSLLAYSPTHAFLVKPHFEKFKEGWWENDAYPYTWVRDKWINPTKYWLEKMQLEPRMMDYIIKSLVKNIPPGYQAHFLTIFQEFPYLMNPIQLREYIIKTLSYEKWIYAGGGMQYIAEQLDSLLYSLLPFFPEYQLWDNLEVIYKSIGLDDNFIETIHSFFDAFYQNLGRYHIFTAINLREVAKGLLSMALDNKKSDQRMNFSREIIKSMQENGFSMPSPILFADTNWVKNYFGFVVNPGTGNFELWRFDENAQEGKPMSMWKPYLNGSQKIPWGIYIAPSEYTL